MNVGLYQGVEAMRASERRLEVITANLANLNTPAYKRQSAATRAFTVEQGGRRRVDVDTVVRTDFRQGALERTASPLDLALVGDGYFAIEGPEGEVYTRNGAFRTDEGGTIVTAEGYPLAWDGPRGRIDPVGEPVRFDLEGNVHQDGRRVGRVKVVRFEAQELLGRDRTGNWRAPRGVLAEPSEAEVHQGALERSNVDGLEELVAMITVQREFEASQNLMQMISQTYRRLNTQR